MYTQDAYYGLGRKTMDANEISVKQYAGDGSSTKARPAMNNGNRRSSSGVYSDEGLASAAAIAALSKGETYGTDANGSVTSSYLQSKNAAISPTNPSSAREDLANQANISKEVSPPGVGVSPPRRRLNVNDSSQISPDAGNFDFPKTLRRAPPGSEAEETVTPRIPLSGRSLRKPHARAATSSSVTSYAKFPMMEPLPTPSKILEPTPHEHVHAPDTTGPLGAKSMRRPGGKAPINFRQASGSAARPALNTGMRATPVNVPPLKSPLPSQDSRPSPAVERIQGHDDGGYYLSAKTLRHPADAPKPKANEPASMYRVPLSSKTLRRPSMENSNKKTSLFGKVRPPSTRRNMRSPTSSQGHMTRQSGGRTEDTVDTTVEESMMPPVVHEHIMPKVRHVDSQQIRRDIHTHDVYDRIQPIRVKENLPARHYIPDPTTGDLREIPDPAHSQEGFNQLPDPNRATEAKTVAAVIGGVAQKFEGLEVHDRTSHAAAAEPVTPGAELANQERIFVRETTTTSPGGTTRTESVWRYPPIAADAATAGIYGTPLAARADRTDWAEESSAAAAAIESPSRAQGMRNKTPKDGYITVSQPVQTPPRPPKSPMRNTVQSQSSVTASSALGIPPPATEVRQRVHTTARNDLGPTHHTDIDQRRKDSYEPYAGLDSESYLAPAYHDDVPVGFRRPRAATEWNPVPEPKQSRPESDEQSPIGARLRRPTSTPNVPVKETRGQAKSLRDRIEGRSSGEANTVNQNVPTQQLMRNRPNSARNTINQQMPFQSPVRTNASSARDTVTQKISLQQQIETGAMNVRDIVSKQMPRQEQIKTGAMTARDTIAAPVPSQDTMKNVAMDPQGKISGQMSETTNAAKQTQSLARNVASTFAAGIRSMMPATTEQVTTPHLPGAYESEGYTSSERDTDARSSRSSHSSAGGSPPMKTENRRYVKTPPREAGIDSPPLQKLGSSRPSIRDPPTALDYENKVVPGGVIKDGHALVGPGLLMEDRKKEEELSKRKLKFVTAQEDIAVTHNNGAHELKFARQQNDDYARATDAVGNRENRRSATNFLKSEADTMIKKLRAEADEGWKVAKSSKKQKDVKRAQRVEDDYAAALVLNQKVLKENYRSGLGVTVKQGVGETSKQHSSKLDGVRQGEGRGPPIGFSPTHTVFPTPFSHEEGAMGEGTESEVPSHHTSNTCHQSSHHQERPKAQPGNTTGSVLTHHTVFPEHEPFLPLSIKPKTVSIPGGVHGNLEAKKASPPLPPQEAPTEHMTKSQKKRMRRKQKGLERDEYTTAGSLALPETPSQEQKKKPMANLDERGLKWKGTETGWPTAIQLGTRQPLSYADMAQKGDLEDKVGHGEFKLL